MIGYFLYSKECKFCQDLIRCMMDMNILNLFQVIPPDKMDEQNLIKWNVSRVPALIIIKRFPDGRTTEQVYEGQDAFTWTEKFIEVRRMAKVPDSQSVQKLIQFENIKSRKDGINGYSSSEMEGLSDSYTYCNPELSATPKSFVQYDGDVGFKVDPICTYDGQQTEKLSRKIQNDMMRTLEIDRSKDLENIKELNKKQQVNIVVQRELK